MNKEFGHLPYTVKLPGFLDPLAYQTPMCSWCYENINGDWDMYLEIENTGLYAMYCFAIEDDAVFFKLRWL